MTTTAAHPYGAIHKHLRASTPGRGTPCPGFPMGYHDARPGAAPPALELDHVRPVAHGGTARADNVRWLCVRCNRAKGVDERTVAAGGRSWRTA